MADAKQSRKSPDRAHATPASRATVELGEAARFSSSLVAGLAILDCFCAERPQMGIAALADQLDMTRSTTHRYAATLVALGYLEQDHARQYRLAPRVADLGLALLDSMTLRRDAHESLLWLRGQTGRTVSMAILDRGHIRYIERLRGWRQGQHGADLHLGLAARQPIHCTAMGKVLLAYLPEPRQEALISELELFKQGPNAITSKKELRTELGRIRRAGIAVSDEEQAPGLRAIAAPVLDEQGLALAAVAVATPSEALSRKELVTRIGPLVETAAERAGALAQSQLQG
jgi:IclR family transcriptional regulator, pca regulon regulatory protein